MAQDELTSQPLASEQVEPAGTAGQTQDDVALSPEQSVTAEDNNLIPEKFVGKSAAEIAQAYRELERERGRLASELGSSRKEQEEMQERFRQLETQQPRTAAPTQVPPQVTQPIQQEVVDPLSVLESKFDEDPKAAIREALRLQQEALHKSSQQESIQTRASQANEWYYQQKRDNPDYARRESLMQQAVSQYGHLFKPEQLNSVQALQMLDVLSKGMDVKHYEQQAVEAAQKSGSAVLDEKRRAQSESSNSEGDVGGVRFEDLSLEEMEKMLSIEE